MSGNKKIALTAIAVITMLTLVVALVPTGSVYASSTDKGGGPGGPGGKGPVNGVGVAAAQAPLTDAEIAGLQDAILEEYGALNLYTAVITQFGSAYPFDQIARSEQQHVNVLVRQAQKYGVEVPANPGLTTAPAFATLADACQAGVDAEIADAALYDDLMADTANTALEQVYTNLQSASLNSHLVAFQTCD